MTVAPVAAKSEPNFFQKKLIPEESRNVRYLMIKAAYFSSSEHLFVAHFVSVTLAVAAVALSAINVLSYLLRIPIKILLNVVQFCPLRLFVDLAQDFVNVARSLLFVSLGVAIIVVGFLLPQPFFSSLAPEYYQSYAERLKHESEQKDAENRELAGQVGKEQMLQNDQRAALIGDQDELEELTARNKELGKRVEELEKVIKGFKSCDRVHFPPIFKIFG